MTRAEHVICDGDGCGKAARMPVPSGWLYVEVSWGGAHRPGRYDFCSCRCALGVLRRLVEGEDAMAGAAGEAAGRAGRAREVGEEAKREG